MSEAYKYIAYPESMMVPLAGYWKDLLQTGQTRQTGESSATLRVDNIW